MKLGDGGVTATAAAAAAASLTYRNWVTAAADRQNRSAAPTGAKRPRENYTPVVSS